MDNKFTELIKQWLETPSDQRDYSVGALYLLKLSGNQIMYRNLVAKYRAETLDIEDVEFEEADLEFDTLFPLSKPDNDGGEENLL